MEGLNVSSSSAASARKRKSDLPSGMMDCYVKLEVSTAPYFSFRVLFCGSSLLHLLNLLLQRLDVDVVGGDDASSEHGSAAADDSSNGSSGSDVSVNESANRSSGSAVSVNGSGVSSLDHSYMLIRSDDEDDPEDAAVLRKIQSYKVSCGSFSFFFLFILIKAQSK